MMKSTQLSRSPGIYLLIPLLLLMLSACSTPEHEWHGTPYDPPRPAPDFSVEWSDFSLAEQRGTLVLLYFGYTYCPDVCPATISTMNQVFNALDAKPEDVRFIMISVDPERETPESVDAYMRRFHPDFVGLWVEREQLEGIMDAYGITAIREPSDDPETYLITHTARVYLIDQEGNFRAHYPFASLQSDYIADINYLLNELND
jgi:protein SCO1/2